MKKLSNIKKGFALAGIGLFSVVSLALAQESTSTSNSVGIEVSSPIYEYSLNPGDTQQDIIKIKNTGSSTATYYPIVVNFKSNNKDGSPVFLKEGEENGSFSLAKWIEFSKQSITLEKGKSEAFNFNITLPKDAEPGGHYGAILFSTKPASGQGNSIEIASQVGSLILVRVSGNVTENLSVTSFAPDKPNYPDATNVNFNLSLKNSGNVHVQPKGVVTISNILGGRVAALDFNQNGTNVLGGSSRDYSIAWKELGFKIGFYSAKIDLTYGNGKSVSAVTSFWIIPWMTIGLSVLVLVLLVIIFIFGIRRYNAWILSRAKSSNK